MLDGAPPGSSEPVLGEMVLEKDTPRVTRSDYHAELCPENCKTLCAHQERTQQNTKTVTPGSPKFSENILVQCYTLVLLA